MLEISIRTMEKTILQAWVLEPKRAVEIARLEEPNKSTIDGRIWVACGIADKGGLIGLEHIFPIVRSFEIFLGVRSLAHISRHLCDAEIIVCILDSARYGASEWATSVRVKVIRWDVSQGFPACQASTPFNGPIQRFIFNS
jgi:hypothetical protein